MVKGKEKIIDKKGVVIFKYKDPQVFCEDFPRTQWCEEEFLKEVVIPHIKLNELYVISIPKGIFLLTRDKENNFIYNTEAKKTYLPSAPLNIDDSGELYILMNYSPDFFLVKLYGFLKGKVDKDELLEYPLLEDIIVEDPIFDSKIVFKLPDSYLEDFFGIDEGDRRAYMCISDGYCNLEYPESFKDSLDEGDIDLTYFSNSGSLNRTKLDDIYTMIDPTYRFGSPSKRLKIMNLLNSIEDGSVYNILRQYTQFRNRAISEWMKEKIDDDMNRLLSKIDSKLILGEDTFLIIPVSQLYYLMKRYGKDSFGLFQNLYEVFDKIDLKFGDWRDLGPDDEENVDGFFDWDGYNETIEGDVEFLYESVKNSKNLKELSNILDNYGGGFTQRNPITNQIFKIEDVNPKEGTVRLFLTDSDERRKVNLTPEEFWEWMTNEKLKFESRNILLSLRKILSHDSQ